MSHINTIKCVMNDLEAIKRVCARKGWTFVQGQSTFNWFGQWVGDTEMPEGFFTEAEKSFLESMEYSERKKILTELFGKCHHAIQVPGATYEIGVVQKSGQWFLLYDYYQTGGLHQNLLEDVAQLYGVEKSKLLAEAQGFQWKEVQLENKKIVLECERW